jgi:hypothetical protein
MSGVDGVSRRAPDPYADADASAAAGGGPLAAPQLAGDETLMAIGVDGMITNNPALLARLEKIYQL